MSDTYLVSDAWAFPGRPGRPARYALVYYLYFCPSFVLAENTVTPKGVFGGPSGPSREGPGVGHKIASDTKQMTKERKKKKQKWEKRKTCKEKENGRKRERKMGGNKEIQKCSDTDRDKTVPAPSGSNTPLLAQTCEVRKERTECEKQTDRYTDSER